MIGFFSAYLGFKKGRISGKTGAEEEFQKLDRLEEKKPRAFEKEKKRMQERRERTRKNVLKIEIAIFILLFTTLNYQAVVLTYESLAVNNFEQDFVICLPYLTLQERDQIRSAFAQIKTKTEYLDVLKQLQKVAETQKIKLPEFSVW